MKKNKIITLSITVAAVVCIVMAFVFFYLKSGGNKKVKSTQTETSEYTVKQKINEDNIKTEDIKSSTAFDVSDAAEKNKELIVTANADIDDSTEAYKTAVVIEETVSDLNKDKIKKDGISKIEVILKGRNKSWMYDGSSSISEITLKQAGGN